MKIAAVVDDLALSQNSFYMIQNFNKISKNLSNETYCFYNNLSAHGVTPLFSTMNIYYASSFYNGKLICTSLANLDIILKLNTSCTRFLYLWDLEWLRGNSRYMDSIRLMRDPKVKLLARSDSHAEIIENYCNKNIHAVVDDWNYLDLEKI